MKEINSRWQSDSLTVTNRKLLNQNIRTNNRRKLTRKMLAMINKYEREGETTKTLIPQMQYTIKKL